MHKNNLFFRKSVASMPDGQGRGADLQLVELVREGGKSKGPARGVDEQAAASRARWGE
jgi:hypothetical protein